MATKQHDVYVEYCLSGIKFITYKFDDENSRIGNESFVLVNCLKNMSTVDSVKSVLEWLSKERNTDFHGFDDVLESNVISAVKLYLNGHNNL